MSTGTRGACGLSSQDEEFSALRGAVQRNCHIADARHAGDYTLCVYLLKMREFFRWEESRPFGAALPNDTVGRWLRKREELWGTLEDAPFDPLAVAGGRFDPFDTRGINEALAPRGLVYSGGLGRRGRPHFFLARLERSGVIDGRRVMVAAEEFARDLAAPPAMTLGDTIFVRRESLRRLIWERIEEWRWNRPENAMARTLRCYGAEDAPQEALEEITGHETDAVLNHELGEIMAGERLGEAWEEMLLGLSHTPAELMARAVRDHLADCLSTLPGLLRESQPASLHFYFANFSGMRRELFPALQGAYEGWCRNGDPAPLAAAVREGERHWLGVAREMLAVFRRHDGAEPLESLLGAARL